MLEEALIRAAQISPIRQHLEDGDCIEFHLMDPESMAELNWEHLKHEGPTDVITFSYLDDGDDGFAFDPERTVGEIFVCPEIALQMAGDFDQSLSAEVLLYLIHGILHLSGLDDHTDEDIAEMRQAERETMSRLREEFAVDELIAVPAE